MSRRVAVARTGKELIAFFQASPLVGLELDLERDNSPPREVDLDFDIDVDND